MSASHTTKRFFNQYETIVQQAIDGLISASGEDENGNPRLVRLDGYPHIKVVVRGDWQKDKVAIISGGGAGHEPAHAGFVGKGMLTAAVSGEIFASPTVDAVLEAICTVSGEMGCLLIVKNYTGDRLNFGLAAERAKKMGHQVEMVIVGDDIAIPESAQPRGVAGTLFAHKFAGHLAEQGESLANIKQKTEAFAQHIYSLGMSLSTCSQPGREVTERLEPNQAEIGLGIHGEPGRSKIPMQTATELCTILADQLLASLPANDARYGLLVNNLGAVPPMEMSLIMHELGAHSLMDKVDFLFGPGHLMTALNMNGFSLSLVALDAASVPALLSEVSPAAWLSGVKPATVRTLERPNIDRETHYDPSQNERVKHALTQVEAAISAARKDLDALDAKVGDGDAGSTFATGVQAITERMDKLPLADTTALLGMIGAILGKTMGGSSGILLSIFFNASSKAMHGGESIGTAMQTGIQQMQFYGGAKEGARTMLDAMIPALSEWVNSGNLPQAAQQADAGAKSTAQVTHTVSGRSAYIPESELAGVEDPGARAIAIIVQTLANTLN